MDGDVAKSLLRHLIDDLLRELNSSSWFGNFKDTLQEIEDRAQQLKARGRDVKVVAIGKVAAAMLESFLASCHVPNRQCVISAPYLAEPKGDPGQYFSGGHPLPNSESLAAASAALKTLHDLSEDDLVVFLISGGGSAAFELPKDPRITLADLRETYQLLVGCGAKIGEINLVRQQLSAVKGGRLAAAAFPATQVSFFVSDVPNDELDSISSGPTTRPGIPPEPTQLILDRFGLSGKLPPSVARVLSSPDEGAIGEKHFTHSTWNCLVSNADALNLARSLGEKAGWRCEIENAFDEAETSIAVNGLLHKLDQDKGGTPFCLIAGGEVRNRITGSGQGGRNQDFVLECVKRISNRNIAVMSVGTDGIDGNSPAAGAIAIGDSFRRGCELNLDIDRFRSASNAFRYFSQLGDDVVSGPTGHNVRDVRLLLKW